MTLAVQFLSLIKMAIVELIGIIIVGVLSFMDLVLNSISMCMTGRCKTDCFCFKFDHESEDTARRSKSNESHSD